MRELFDLDITKKVFLFLRISLKMVIKFETGIKDKKEVCPTRCHSISYPVYSSVEENKNWIETKKTRAAIILVRVPDRKKRFHLNFYPQKNFQDLSKKKLSRERKEENG